mgnify:CR=1 FL=1
MLIASSSTAETGSPPSEGSERHIRTFKSTSHAWPQKATAKQTLALRHFRQCWFWVELQIVRCTNYIILLRARMYADAGKIQKVEINCVHQAVDVEVGNVAEKRERVFKQVIFQARVVR